MKTPSPGPRPRQRHVLIVDDDLDVATALGQLITEHGYRTSISSNGEEALTVLSRDTPSLILIDLMMPVMNGSTLIQNLKKDPRLARIPRVLMTGVNDLMIGVKEDVEVIYKPLDAAELLALLDRRSARPV